MYSNNSNGSRAAPARGFMALFSMLAMGLRLMASPAEAAPFAYVVSVIDTATNTVVTTVPLGISSTNFPFQLAVAPDGKHVYALSDSKVL